MIGEPGVLTWKFLDDSGCWQWLRGWMACRMWRDGGGGKEMTMWQHLNQRYSIWDAMRCTAAVGNTVPFHSIRQSHITGPSKMLKCHGCQGNFHRVLNSFGNHVTNIQIFSSPAALNCRKFPKNLGMSRQLWEVTELNKMVQYHAFVSAHRNRCCGAVG